MNYWAFTKRAILILPVICWCVVIFNFSAQNSEESSNTSKGFITAVCELILPEFDNFTGEERAEFIEKLQFGVRKSAHFTAYAVLGFLSWFVLYGIKKGRRYLFAVGFSFLYACSDEIHQIFVPGRSSEVRDVLIDTGGAALGALIALGLTVMFLHFRSDKKENS